MKKYLILLIMPFFFGILTTKFNKNLYANGIDCCVDCPDYCACSRGPTGFTECWRTACPGSSPDCEGVGSKCCFAMQINLE